MGDEPLFSTIALSGEWVRTSPDINPYYADRVGRVVEENTETLPTRIHTEILVRFPDGREAWFLSSELSSAKRPRNQKEAEPTEPLSSGWRVRADRTDRRHRANRRAIVAAAERRGRTKENALSEAAEKMVNGQWQKVCAGPSCDREFLGTLRRKFCSDSCRVKAHRLGS